MIIDYSDSEEIEIKGWISRTCAARNIEIKDSAINLFLEYINSDQVRMVNELDKIMNYVNDGGIIDEQVVIYSKEKSEQLYNVIDNDFATIKELYEEYKREVYPLFPVKGIMLLSVLPKSDVDKIYSFLSDYLKDNDSFGIDKLLFQIYKTLMYFPSAEYRSSVKEFLSQSIITDERLESVMGSIKQHKKDLKSEGLENSYIELLAMYFDYLCKEFKHV